MGVRRLRLEGFETEILDWIGDGFRFRDPSLRDLRLVLDRNLFPNDLPAPEEIATTASEADASAFPFDPKKEPAIALYTQPGTGIAKTMSSGSRLAFNLLIVLRIPATLQDAVDSLRELVLWMEKYGPGARTEHYLIRDYSTLGNPVPYRRYIGWTLGSFRDAPLLGRRSVLRNLKERSDG